MGDPTLVIVAEDVTEKFMPPGVTDPNRASTRLVWPRGQVVRQADVDAFKERNEGTEVPLAERPSERTVLTLGRIVDLDAPAGRRDVSGDAPVVAGSVPQNPDAPGVEAEGETPAPAPAPAQAPAPAEVEDAKPAASSSKGRSTASKGSAKDEEGPK